jgi:transposase
MIKVKLTTEQQLKLESFRKQASSKDSEKALMVLLSNDGKSVSKIALMLRRNQHTIRDWLKRYGAQGINGLSRNFSPGRPNTMREKIKKYIEQIIGNSPINHGYQDSTWSVPLITHEVNKNLNLNASSKTVTRALKNMGYVYKRPSKTIIGHAPSKEEKQDTVKKMVRGILKIIDQQKSVIYTLDESHFSTEPYLVQGWFKKRWAPQDSNTKKERKSHLLWMLEYKNTKILLEKIDKVRQ